MFDNSSLGEQLFLKQQPNWLIDSDRDYVGRREDVTGNYWVRGRIREEEGPLQKEHAAVQWC